ncbi:MAG: hypothetical protein methR_P1644 [Methyloprofundus sp.]|nr:MAG: hypothetical protein methR_P1644 [Methyloprofundus sp.]
MAYDGTTPLQPLIAELIGCSPKNQSKIANVTKQAKLDLGITSKARRLPHKTKIQIHKHLVELYSQSDDNKLVEIISQPDSAKPVETISQDNATKIPEPQNTQQITVEINSQDNECVEIFSHANNFDNVRVAFYVTRDGERERQVISLDGYFINALASIKVSKQDVPQWVQAQVNDWMAFDSKFPITRQVKYLIMREVVKVLSGSDDLFHVPTND